MQINRSQNSGNKAGRLALLVIPLLFLAAGCHRDDVEVHRVGDSQSQMSAQPDWKVPAGWQEVPAGQSLVAKFNMPSRGGGERAAVNVSMSAGDGGGLAANVNRWRGQLGLAPVSDVLAQYDAVQTSLLDVTGGKAQMIVLTGLDQQTGMPSQLVGVIVSQTGKTWFYKLMGTTMLVSRQKDAFIQFVQSVRYPDAH